MGPAFTPLHRVSTLSGTAPNHALEWLFATIGLGLALELGLRPLRRHLLLRHLRSGLWPETVDQRVSNLWQLMLVGLRDGGWHSVSGEQPEELARRIGVPEAAGCAAVLERARHGVRVEPLDLAAMTRDAQLVYRAARRRAGLLARAAGWLRWPLI